MSSSKLLTIPYTKELQSLARIFTCGNIEIDNFLKSPTALDRDFGATYVMLSQKGDCIIGYYCISTGQLNFQDEFAKYKEGGSAHICYFALDQRFHGIKQDEAIYGDGTKLSDVLLADCFERIREVRDNHIGFGFVTLGATMQGRSLYERNGFVCFEPEMVSAKYVDDGDTIQMYYAFGLEEV